jgi:UDP-GlcNAc:undecaprenyl-phosphate GlcNAc-1-phosphate transferase
VLATDVDRRLVVGALLFLAIGVLDDVRPFGVAEKLAFQVVAAAIVVGLGLTLPITGFGLGDGLLALVWIIAVVNAVNVTDVCDGLVTGLAVVALFWIGALDADVRLFSLIGVGACLGFLVFNRPPASIFLGDAGAHILGFLVAGLTLVAAHDVPSWRERAAIPFVIAVPLFELALLVVVRGRRGVPWWHASPDHFSLRLQAAGVSRWHTIALAWGIAVILALLAWSTTVAMPWGG